LEFNIPFQHKYGYIRDKRLGVESYPYPVKEGQRYTSINLNPGHLFVQQPPKRERDRKAHLNYYASAYNSSTATRKGKGSRGSFKLLRQRLQQKKTTITQQD